MVDLSNIRLVTDTQMEKKDIDEVIRARRGDLVKSKFIDPVTKLAEYMWLEIQYTDDYGIHGYLQNTPILNKQLKWANMVHISYDEVYDILWEGLGEL